MIPKVQKVVNIGNQIPKYQNIKKGKKNQKKDKEKPTTFSQYWRKLVET